MAAYENKIKQLISLASHSSEVNRELVYRKLVTLLLDPRVTGNAEEMSALLRLLDALTPSVGMECRIEISRLVAARADAPMALAEHLATDMASVAAPILKKFEFDQDALLRIIKATGRAHHLLIAERPDLTARLWEALSNRPKARSRAKAAATAGAGARGPSPIEALAALAREPGRDLATLARGMEAPPFLLDDPARGFAWTTNREGRISGLSPHARAAFGRTAESLKGLFFFALIEPLAESIGEYRIGTILTRHLPIRDLPIEIEDNMGGHSNWTLRAQARFNLATGRFTGYQGQALEDPGEDRDAGRAPGAVTSLDAALSRRVMQDARMPVADSLAAAFRLRKKLGAMGDPDLMADLSDLMDGCYRMRDLMEDMENALAPDLPFLRGATTRFELAALAGECLRENIIRHGGVSRLRLESSSPDIPVSFDRRLAYQAVMRMLSVAEARAGVFRDQMITIARAPNGKIEIKVPLGDTGSILMDEEVLFSPAAYLRRAPSPMPGDNAPSLSPEFGLSAARSRLRALGGNIYLGQTAGDSQWLAMAIPPG